MAANNPNPTDLETLDDLDWSVRAYVYSYIVEHEIPPTVDVAAADLALTPERAALAFRRLHHRHALFLEPGTLAIRMAHPFSGIPTRFRVRANGHSYWANCPWDMLGIAAALHADAEIEAFYGDDQSQDASDRVTLRVANNQVSGHSEVVHFLLPFRAWYDDLIYT